MRNSAVSFTKAAATLQSPSNSSTISYSHSAWNSPVPYLFGGLAAMLGLIAFALLVLTCSYWNLSGQLDHSDDPESASNRDDDKPTDPAKNVLPRPYEERIVVIMAGDSKPTFLGTPVSGRDSSFNLGDGICSDCGAIKTVQVDQEFSSSPNHDNLQRQELWLST